MENEAGLQVYEQPSGDGDALRYSCPLCSRSIVVDDQPGISCVVCPSCDLSFRLDVAELKKEREAESSQPPVDEAEEPAEVDESDPNVVVERWLAGAPIEPRESSDWEKFAHWCRSHPVKAGVFSVMAALLVIATVASTLVSVGMSVALTRTKTVAQQQQTAHQEAQDDLENRLNAAEQEQQEVLHRFNQATRDARMEYAARLAERSQNLGVQSTKQSAALAAEALSIALAEGGPVVPIAHQSLRDALGGNDGWQLDGHADRISAIAISPSSRWLASGSFDSTARLWDMTSPDPAGSAIVLDAHSSCVSSVAFSPDNRWLMTASLDSTVCMWDLASENPSAKPLVLRGHDGRIGVMAVSPDGRWLATGGGGFIPESSSAFLWDLTTKNTPPKPVGLSGHVGPIRVVKISPNTRWLVTAGEDGAARLWNLTAKDPSTVSLVLKGHSGPIQDAVFSSDNRWLVTTGGGGVGSNTNTARLWDLTSEVPSASLVLNGHDSAVRAVAIGPNNRWLVTVGDDAMARAWDLAANNPAAASKNLPGHHQPIQTVAISADGQWVVTGGADGTARLWNMGRDGPESTSVVLHPEQGGITSTVFSPDSRYLVTAGTANTIRVWNLRLDELVEQASEIAASGDQGADAQAILKSISPTLKRR